MTTTSGATAQVGPRSQLRPCESTQGVTCTSAPEGRPHPHEHLRRHHNASDSNSEDKLSSIPAGCGPGRAGRFMADLAARSETQRKGAACRLTCLGRRNIESMTSPDCALRRQAAPPGFELKGTRCCRGKMWPTKAAPAYESAVPLLACRPTGCKVDGCSCCGIAAEAATASASS